MSTPASTYICILMHAQILQTGTHTKQGHRTYTHPQHRSLAESLLGKHGGLSSIPSTHTKLGTVVLVYNPSVPMGWWEVELSKCLNYAFRLAGLVDSAGNKKREALS